MATITPQQLKQYQAKAQAKWLDPTKVEAQLRARWHAIARPKQTFGRFMWQQAKEFTAPTRQFFWWVAGSLASFIPRTAWAILKWWEYIGEQMNRLDRYMTWQDVQTPQQLKWLWKKVIKWADVAEKKVQRGFWQDVPWAPITSVWKVVWDVGQSIVWWPKLPSSVAWMWLRQGAKTLWALWARWAVEWARYGLGTKWELDRGEIGVSAVVESAIPVVWLAGKAIKKSVWQIPAKLQLSGLLNPAKLDYLRNQLITEWSEDLAKAQADDLAEWMFQRNIKGNKQEIVQQLWNVAQQSKSAVDNLLAWSNKTYQFPEASRAIEDMYNTIMDVPWLWEQADELISLIKWADNYRLSELQSIKRQMDDIYNIYKTSWDVKAWVKAKWLNNLRVKVKRFIEEKAIEEWLWGMKNWKNVVQLLNNQTQIAKWLEEAISRKESADFARELIQFLWWRSPGAIVWWTVGATAWPFDSSTTEWKIGNIMFGMIVWWAAWNTKVKTTVANALSSIPKKQQSEIYQWMISWWEKQMSKSVNKNIEEIVKKLNQAWAFSAQAWALSSIRE